MGKGLRGKKVTVIGNQTVTFSISLHAPSGLWQIDIVCPIPLIEEIGMCPCMDQTQFIPHDLIRASL